MQLSVIIVNYNVQYFLEQALYAVRRASEGVLLEVFVVDNNSKDGSCAMVREKFPEVILIENKVNTGFSKANNQAIEISKGKYVLLLNPDTVVAEDTFIKCIAFMDAHPEAGGLGVKMIDGKGDFLPESKRGFPSPDVAFYKTFGLSKFFPKSPTFNRYHLGFLDKDQTHEVDVLSGAFMWMRKETLDKIGHLDEAFFMYGEDIDLSYRIILGGYKNYYFADTCIIHYKGESTKKGSLNYVKTFYQAMIIFARKHFSGSRAGLFVAMLQGAIWLRASLTVMSNFFRSTWLVLADAALIYAGMFTLKNLWANLHFDNPWYYEPSILWFNFPLYITLWLVSVYFSGGYDSRQKVREVLRGLFVGTILVAAVYGFLNAELRSSRALIVMGAAWSVVATVGLRGLINLVKEGSFFASDESKRRVLIVGEETEAERVLRLLQKAQIDLGFHGIVYPRATKSFDTTIYVGQESQLADLVDCYQIDEIIFCQKYLSAHRIISNMTQLGRGIDYKIIAEDSDSIIGSNSKDTAGDLYTLDIRFKLANAAAQRNKRVTDVCAATLLLLLSPLLVWFQANKLGFIKGLFAVLTGQQTLVGYQESPEPSNTKLPKLKPGLLSPLDALRKKPTDAATINRLNLLYAKDYQASRDWEILWRAWRRLDFRL